MMIAGKFIAGKFALPGLVLCAILSLAGCGENEDAPKDDRPDTTVTSAPPVQGPNTGGDTAPDTTPATPKPPAKDTTAPKPAEGADQQKITTEYLAARKQLIDVITGIRSQSDLTNANSKLAAAYSKVAGVITKYQGKSSALKAAHTGSQVKELDQRLASHLQQLATENPTVLRALTKAMQQHGASLAKLESKILKDAVDD